MINEASLVAVGDEPFGTHFIRPRYDAYGFAQIPQTLRALFINDAKPGVSFGPRGGLYQRYDAVVLCLADALGWRFFEQWGAHHPLLRRATADGVVTKLTSQFPSTTAAHVTAIHTGIPVGESGVHEWYYYEPTVDAVIAPLLYSFAGDHERDTLRLTNVAPEALYPNQTLYQEFAAHGVRSYVFQHLSYAHSPYTKVVTQGATIVPYRTLPEAIVQLGQLLEHQQQPSYYFLYYDAIDTLCHWHGPESPQVAAEIETFLDIMDRQLHSRLQRTSQRTLFLLTADHGQTAIDPRTTIYLNRTLPVIKNWIETNRSGDLLVPTGASRDLFLRIKPPYLDEAHEALRTHLHGAAEVHRVDTLIEDGFFGPTTSVRFRERVGNLVVLPYDNASVWWWEQGRFEQPFFGQHGGLSRNELETLLVAQPYG